MAEITGEQRTAAPDGRPANQQPDWRREFPIDIPEDQYLARRGFTKFLVVTSLAFVVGQLWIAAQNWVRKRRGQLPIKEIASLIPGHDTLPHLPVGGAVMFRYPGEHDSCLLVRPEGEQLLAYDQKCSHLSCAVIPSLEKGCLNCPCHHGVFDLATGRPIAGPPRRPLPRVKLEVSNGIVRATDVEYRAV